MGDDEKIDFESTTAMLKRRAPGLAWLPSILRERFTPAALGSAITALVVAITYVVNAQHELHHTQETVQRLQDSISGLEKERDVLRDIHEQLAVMATKVDNITTEVDKQREWRERIETVAEEQPRARRKH